MKRKILIMLFTLSAMLIIGCDEKKEKEETRALTFWNPELVDKKIEMNIGSKEFENNLNKILSSKSLLNYLGPGEHHFNINLNVDQNGKVFSFEIPKQLYSDSQSKLSYLLQSTEFNTFIRKVSFSPAEKEGKKVGSTYSLHLMTILNSDGGFLKPWVLLSSGFLPEQMSQLKREKISSEEAFTFVEEMPSFPKGQEELMSWIGQNVRYPEVAKRAGIEGRVMVQFVVEKSGKITEVSVIKGIGGGCDEEAVRVTKMMPKWTPGKQGGKPVRVRMVIPFLFKLQ